MVTGSDCARADTEDTANAAAAEIKARRTFMRTLLSMLSPSFEPIHLCSQLIGRRRRYDHNTNRDPLPVAVYSHQIQAVRHHRHDENADHRLVKVPFAAL